MGVAEQTGSFGGSMSREVVVGRAVVSEVAEVQERGGRSGAAVRVVLLPPF
jgi:hypothetical protein